MLLANKLVQLLDNLFRIVHRYVLELIILMFLCLFGFWTVGYFANSLYGYHFDLSSCWGGFSAIGGAGVLAAVRYCTDSWKNSPVGQMPGNINGGTFDKLLETVTGGNKRDRSEESHG